LRKKLKTAGKGKLVAVHDNIIDIAWGNDRPRRPKNPVFILEEEFAGNHFQEKLSDLRKELAEKKVSGMVLSMLDEVAWLFNLRGSDIDYNPVFFAYALITQTDVTLFIDEDKLPEDVKSYLKDVKISPYDEIMSELMALGANIDAEVADSKIFLSNKASWALTLNLGEKKVSAGRSPVQDSKAVKNEVEQEGMRQCHIRDGTALVEYFAWLENQLEMGKTLDEVQGSDKLEEFRRYAHVHLTNCSKTKFFVGLSFDTISATGPNGAVIHYKPEKGTCATIQKNEIYLCDSGAQFKYPRSFPTLISGTAQQTQLAP
jgi:Xaa-Pro aminopeptidase